MNDPAPTIRVRTDADLPGAAAALVEVHDTDGYPVEGVADPIAWLTSNTLRQAWIAELDSRIVGHVSISDPQPDDAAATMWREQNGDNPEAVAVLGRLFVVKDARRRATGEKLMHAAQNHAHETGLRLVLDVMTKDAAAIKLYERLGWQRIGTTDHDNGHGDTIPAYCYVSPA
jgi:GNAT superfamily N-acetyltransferase